MTDEKLMEAVKIGDLKQATWLFERYHKRLYGFLWRMCADQDVAQDLTQNVFLRMIRYRHTYRTGHSFQTWIFQIARNVFTDHYQQTKAFSVMHSDVETVHDKLADPQEEIQRQERENVLHRSLERLDAEQRELIVLTRFQQMKYEEVADLLGLSVANVKVKVHRAINRLRVLYFETERI